MCAVCKNRLDSPICACYHFFMTGRSQISMGFIGILVSFIFAITPIAIAIGAGATGSLVGCNINEAGTDPCIVLGVPLGDTLAGFFVFGWLGLLTIPLGALGALLSLGFVVVGTVRFFIHRKDARVIDQGSNVHDSKIPSTPIV